MSSLLGLWAARGRRTSRCVSLFRCRCVFPEGASNKSVLMCVANALHPQALGPSSVNHHRRVRPRLRAQGGGGDRAARWLRVQVPRERTSRILSQLPHLRRSDLCVSSCSPTFRSAFARTCRSTCPTSPRSSRACRRKAIRTIRSRRSS